MHYAKMSKRLLRFVKLSDLPSRPEEVGNKSDSRWLRGGSDQPDPQTSEVIEPGVIGRQVCDQSFDLF
jgi:hypothetical protein